MSSFLTFLVLSCLTPSALTAYCYGAGTTPCTFTNPTDKCFCDTIGVIIKNTYITCGPSEDGSFPVIPYYASGQIASFSVIDSFSSIDDNAIYGLANLTQGTLCIENSNGVQSDLTTYDNSFLTVNPNGVTTLAFYYYNPLNLSTMANNKYVTSIGIALSSLSKIPDYLIHFPALAVLTLSQNQIKNLQFDGSQLKNLMQLDVSGNQISTLETNAIIRSTFMSFIDLSYNQLTNLNYDAIGNIDGLLNLQVSNNQLKSVDSQYSKWLSYSKHNYLDVSNNKNFACDSTTQWMAKHVHCYPMQINVTLSTCQSGVPLSTYLLPYANCTSK